MTTPATVGCAPGASLADINIIVAQQEAVLGPLIAIGNDGAQTILTFDTDGAAPAKNAVVQAGGGAPAGTTKVFGGRIFIASKLTAATAYR